MKQLSTLVLGGLLLSACGGGSDGGVSPLAFAGTFSVTSALPVGTTTCQTTRTVTFAADGTDIHTATLAGGDCLDFVNADTAPHRPASFGTTPCPALDAPASLGPGAHYTTPPLDGPITCQWQDALHPIPAGGGNGY
jgi:hypothetical protein